jgi:hypothetical protein
MYTTGPIHVIEQARIMVGAGMAVNIGPSNPTRAQSMGIQRVPWVLIALNQECKISCANHRPEG